MQDPTTAHPKFNPLTLSPQYSDQVEYLDLSPTTPKNTPVQKQYRTKTFGQTLCLNVGTTYALALTSGGLWGALEGIRKTNRMEYGRRVKLNGILNAVTRRGPFLGNSAAVAALFYTMIDGAIYAYHPHPDPIYLQVAVPAVAGALFKCTSGFKAMVRGSAICTAVVMGASYAMPSLADVLKLGSYRGDYL